MATETQSKELTVTAQIAATACVGDEGKALLRDDLYPVPYLDLLAEKALFKDALNFFAHAVPTIVTIEWAVECLKHFKPAEPEAGKAKAVEPDPLAASEKWLKTRSEDDRWAAKKAATSCSPAGPLALAVFMAGPSITPPKAPPTPPPPYAAEKLAAGAVRISVLKTDPAKAPENFKRVIDMGKRLAKVRGAQYFAAAK